jgi:hypothetical protein
VTALRAMHSVVWGLMRLPPSVALAVPCLAFIRCVGGRSLCPAWNTRPTAFPFQRAVRVLHRQQQQTSCLCFRFLSPCSPMSSPTFWSDACRNAVGRPLQAQLDAVYASCGVTVSRPPLLPLSGSVLVLLMFALRAALFACNALLCRLLRIVCALWRAGGCCICGGGWMRRGGGACGRCTDGFAG